MSQAYRLTVIIPTLASAERSTSLYRSIQSVRDQDVPCRIIAVVNGDRRDNDVVSALKAAPDVLVITQNEGNLVKALTAGVTVVDTPFFSILDDDDILLPGACKRRVDYMCAHPEADVLVTPGERRNTKGEVQSIPDFSKLDQSDLLGSLLSSNWLASCGGVFRHSRIGHDYFASMPVYLEWTYLAFQLARERTVRFLSTGEPLHYVQYDSADSESAKPAYFLTMPANIARLRESPLPPHIGRIVSEKLARTYHAAASYALRNNMLAAAWKFHLASLKERHGLKYMSFTRHLLRSMLYLRRP